MSDVFISYARESEGAAHRIAEALRALGYGVWRDDEIPAHRLFGDMIEERLAAAKVVLVLWSAEAAKSDWVRSEASRARAMGKLVQLTLDKAPLPIPFDQIQCANLVAWRGEADAPGWRKVISSIDDFADGIAATASPVVNAPLSRPGKPSIAVLPFTNLSGDPEQEYFSDGISEDIITDLSKVSALTVVSRNSAFRYKGQHVDLPKVARELGVSHVLEGSVRKASGRVRITAQLIDGATNDHVWAERYDRDLTDIFALQDEVSEAIVRALKLKLLPQEKVAIERRGTDNPEAYNLYLMARSHWLTGNIGDRRREEAIERLTHRAVDIDPGYAQAWALLAAAQFWLHRNHGRAGDGGQTALERALDLDPDLAEARAIRARMLSDAGLREAAAAEIAAALRLEPDSFEVNYQAGTIGYEQGRFDDAVRHYETAIALSETSVPAASMLVSAYIALGDAENTRRIAQISFSRVEKALAQDHSNGYAMGVGVGALAALGESERAKDWMRRALLLDPDNLMMRYNFACALAARLKDPDAALGMLGPVLERDTSGRLQTTVTDPDLAVLRDDPRFQAMIAQAETRLAADEADGGAVV